MSWLAGGWQIIITKMAPDFELLSTLLEGPYDEGQADLHGRRRERQDVKKTPLPTGHREDAMWLESHHNTA